MGHVLVALIWLVPDRRIEKALSQRGVIFRRFQPSRPSRRSVSMFFSKIREVSGNAGMTVFYHVLPPEIGRRIRLLDACPGSAVISLLERI